MAHAFVAYVRGRVADPFAWLEKMIDKLPRDLAQSEVAAAKERRDALDTLDVADPLVLRHQQTFLGQMELLSLLLRRHHPEATADTAYLIAREVGMERVAAALAAAFGVAAGNPEPLTPPAA